MGILAGIKIAHELLMKMVHENKIVTRPARFHRDSVKFEFRFTLLGVVGGWEVDARKMVGW